MYLISLWIDFGKISLFIHLFIYFSLKHSSWIKEWHTSGTSCHPSYHSNVKSIALLKGLGEIKDVWKMELWIKMYWGNTYQEIIYIL